MKCGKCGTDKEALFRQNPKGEPGVWRCLGCSEAPVDPELAQITAAVEDALNKPTKH